MWGRWVYREVVPPARLVFVNSFSDENAGITRHPGAPHWPLELLSTITFEPAGEKTTVTVQWEAINANVEEQQAFDTSHESMRGGWGGSFDQLEAYLANG